MKDLSGKSVLITVWATWCGPCQAELPHVQQLYEKIKKRSDVQILTFNVDEDFGLVAPYLKEKHYTFPVLSAGMLVNGMFEVLGIPQNWVIDAKGNWLETQMGYLEDGSWEDLILQKLESAKIAK